MKNYKLTITALAMFLFSFFFVSAIPNPASVFCVEQGYNLEIRDTSQGQAGYCVFPNGSECDEWQYYYKCSGNTSESLTTNNCPYPCPCKDSDGGHNYFVKGTVVSSKSNQIYTDYCLDNGRAGVEYYCTTSGDVASEPFVCTKCVDGACTLNIPSPPCDSYGDINSDGYVSAADAELVEKFVVGTETLTEDQKRRADVNGDAEVTSVDAMLIAQYATSIIKNFDVCIGKKSPCNSYGDIDSDNLVTKRDASLVSRYVVGLVTLTDEQKTRADVDGNGEVTAVDAMLIAQYANGIISTFKVCSITPTCSDSDGGRNYYVKGTVTLCKADVCEKKIDSCTYCTGACSPDSSQPCVVTCGAVVENYCGSQGIASETYVCPKGCSYGACIKEIHPETIKVSLNQEFKLLKNQKAIVVDYKYMDVKLLKVVPLSEIICGPDGCISHKPSVQIQVSLPYAYESDNTATAILLDLTQGESKEVFGATIKLLSVTNDAAYFIITKPGAVYCEDQPANADCVCKEGKKVIDKVVCMESYPQKCITYYKCVPETEAIYVKLDEKFTLKESQTAILTEYKPLELTLNNIYYLGHITTASAGAVATTGNIVATNIAEQAMPAENLASIKVRLKQSSNETTSVVEEAVLNIAPGQTKTVFGTDITLASLAPGYAVFVFNKPYDIPDYMDIGIEPRSSIIQKGGRTTYAITVVDKHPVIMCSEQVTGCILPSYTYKIGVIGLPFSKDYPTVVILGAGQRTTIKLSVDTSQFISSDMVSTVEETINAQQTTAVAVTGRIVSSISDVKQLCMNSDKDYNECVLQESKNIAASTTLSRTSATQATTVVAASPALQQIYKFGVRAVSTTDSAVDSAYATLVLTSKEEPPEFPTEKVEIKLLPKWNLISLPGKLVKFLESGCGDLNGYVYMREAKKYVTLQEAKKLLGEEGLKEYLSKNPFWIYAKNACKLTSTVENFTTSTELNLIQGWNLVPVTQDMVGKSLTDVASNCDFQKAYKWSAENQNWIKLTLASIFSENDLYNGLAIKSNNYCELGGGITIESPPSMPE